MQPRSLRSRHLRSSLRSRMSRTISSLAQQHCLAASGMSAWPTPAAFTGSAPSSNWPRKASRSSGLRTGTSACLPRNAATAPGEFRFSDRSHRLDVAFHSGTAILGGKRVVAWKYRQEGHQVRRAGGSGRFQQSAAWAAADVLRVLQAGDLPKGRDVYKRLKEDLAGIDEIRIDGPDGNTYRIYDIIRFREVIYVLDARAKKSTEGGNITKADKRTLLERKKAAEADYKANEVRYKRDYAIRAQVRAALGAARQPKPKGA